MDVDSEPFTYSFEGVKEREEFSILWRVPWTRSLNTADGYYINSPFVESRMCDGCMYYWRLYPAGYQNDERVIKLCQFLRCYNEVSLDIRCEVKLESSFGIVIQSGLVINGHVDGHEGPFCSFTQKDLCRSDGTWNLPDNVLVLRMSVVAYRERPSRHTNSCLGLELGRLRENGSWTDLEIVAQGKLFRAHRTVLAARSPVFSAMVSSPLSEGQTGRIEINDISADTLDGILHYAYTGEVKTADLEALFIASDKYCMQELKNECSARLWFSVTDETALRTLALAERHSCPQLEEKMLRFVSSHPRTRVQASPDLQLMSKEQLLKLMKRIKLPK